MNLIQEEQYLISKIKRAYDIIPKLLLCDAFIAKHRIIEKALQSKDSRNSYEVEYRLNTWELFPEDICILLGKIISKSLGWKVHVNCSVSKTIESVATGKRIYLGMGQGETDEIQQVEIKKMKISIRFNQTPIVDDFYPNFIKITTFTEKIRKAVYDALEMELSYLKNFNRNYSTKHYSIFKRSSKKGGITEISMRIFSDIDEEIINMLKKLKYSYTECSKEAVYPPEVISFNKCELDYKKIKYYHINIEHIFEVVNVTCECGGTILKISIKETVKKC